MMRSCKVTNTPFFLPLPDQAGARTRARHRPTRARTRPQPPTEGSCPPGAPLGQFWLERHLQRLDPGHLHAHKQRAHDELTGIMPSGRLRRTYSTPHTGQDTPRHVVKCSGHSAGAGGARWGVGRRAASWTWCPAARSISRERRCPAAPPAEVGERQPAVGRGCRAPHPSRVFSGMCRPAVARASR